MAGESQTIVQGAEGMNTTSVINEAIEAVIGMMNALAPFATVTRGALPTGPGLSCELGPSNPQTVYLSKNSYLRLDLTMNGKHPNEKTLLDTMNNIHSHLSRARSYPEDANETRWQIVDIENAMFPRIIGREENNLWIAASSMIVKLYWRGD